MLRQTFSDFIRQTTEMAEESVFSKEPAIVWKTVIPSRNYIIIKHRDHIPSHHYKTTSPVFSLLGLKFVLELELVDGLPSHFTVSLRRIGNEHLRTHFSAISHVQVTESMRDGSHFRSQGRMHAVIQDVTTLDSNYIGTTASEKSLPFLPGTEVTVVCVFTDMPSTTSGIPNETDEVMSRTVFDRLLTVDDIHGVKLSSDRCEQGSSSLSPNLDSLSRDLGKLLADEVISDVNLKCADRTIAAHKAILAARSQVFSAMFQSRMLESETGIVDIADVDVQVLEMFLKYVYSGRLTDVPDELLPSLYAVADKYAVGSLKTACSERMISNLTRENCLYILILANAHSDQELKNTIFDFILNHVEILKSLEWTTFSKENPPLSNEVFQFVVQRRLF